MARNFFSRMDTARLCIVYGLRVTLSLSVFFPFTVSATLLASRSEHAQVLGADAIVHGQVIAVYDVFESGKHPARRAIVQVFRSLRGPEPLRMIEVVSSGAESPSGIKTVVSGAAELVAGQEVVAILERNGPLYRPVGMAIGWVLVSGNGEDKRVRRELNGLLMMKPSGEIHGLESFYLNNLSLDNFWHRLRSYLAGTQKPIFDSDATSPVGAQP